MPATLRPRLLGALALGLALSACTGTGLVDPPVGAPYLRGPVESIQSHATATGLLVGPGAQDACGIRATADAGTRFWQHTAAGGLGAATLADVQVGDTVDVYVDGPVAESCPVQGRASAIVRVSRPAP